MTCLNLIIRNTRGIAENIYQYRMHRLEGFAEEIAREWGLELPFAEVDQHCNFGWHVARRVYSEEKGDIRYYRNPETEYHFENRRADAPDVVNDLSNFFKCPPRGQYIFFKKEDKRISINFDDGVKGPMTLVDITENLEQHLDDPEIKKIIDSKKVFEYKWDGYNTRISFTDTSVSNHSTDSLNKDREDAILFLKTLFKYCF